MRIYNKYKKVLGIDPGYGRLGWAVVSGGGSKDLLIDAGCFETPASLHYHERIKLVGDQVKKIIEEHDPDAVALEKIFFHTNQKTALSVAEARGLIIYLSSGRPIYEFAPAQVKSAVCGYGKADKKQVQKMITIILGLSEEPKPDDKADAIAVALSGLRAI